MSHFLVGRYDYQLDEKNRFRIPSEFKNAFDNADSLVMYRGSNNCYVIQAYEDFKKMIDESFKANSVDGSIEELRKKRMIASTAIKIEEDKQGRCTLAKSIRENDKVPFNKDIVFIGMFDKIELWPKEVYEEYIAEVDYDECLTKKSE